MARSFRERRIHPLLRNDTKELVVSSTIFSSDGEKHLGIQKSTKQTILHVNREKKASISGHASYLPVVSMHPDSHQLVQGGGKYRRQYIDWSAFHVKPTFLQHWRAYNKCLRQRNQALRDQCSVAELSVWTKELSEYAQHVDTARSEIFDELKPVFTKYCRGLLPEAEVSVSYHRGWTQELSLEEALFEISDQERQTKTTRLGAHRADLKLFLNGQKAAATASRGQQKLLAACLILAQIEHFQLTSSQSCVVLLDDIRAELDQKHAKALLTALQKLGCQVFITSIDQAQVDLSGWQDVKVFHVKQGVCK